MRLIQQLALVILSATSAIASDYYVDTSAPISGDGSFATPFQTIQAAADVLTAGDACHIRGGTYRETLDLTASGSNGNEIVFTAYQDEDVIISGLDLLNATWMQGSNGIWQTAISNDVHELLTNNWAMVFIGDTPCVEARWPNMKYTENWIEENKWAMLDEGPSEYGKLVCSEIGTSGLDFNGANLHMKWLKNDFATRSITNHTSGSDAVYYPQKHDHGNPDNIPQGHGGYDPRFYIDGKLDLLDVAEEWFYDASTQTLYLKTPGNLNPASLNIGIKARRYGIVANEIAFNRFEQINLLATSFRFGEERISLCDNITLKNCTVLYPDENRIIDTESIGRADLSDIAQPYFCVENGWIESCEFGWSEHRGLSTWTRGTTITNCVFHDTALNGQMSSSGVRVLYGYANSFSGSGANTIVNSTVYNSGGVAIYHMGPGPNHVVYNHCFNAGLYAGDISVLYLPYGLKAGGTVVAHNWVHWAPHGLGMRCDTLGNDIAVHHNVVWDCNRSCKWQGYGPFQVNNNTYYSEHLFFDGDDGTNGVDILNNSDCMNNIFTNRLYFRTPDLDYASHPAENNNHFKKNVQINKPYAGNIYDTTNLFTSIDRASLDLRPKAASMLIDNGTVIPGVTDGYTGSAPDIGAYEFGGTYWVPGADWLPDDRTPPNTMAEATELAARILAEESQVSSELQIEYLIVAGGGGGGSRVGGGGGAGGLIHNFNNPFTPDLNSYPIVVGSGGIGGSGYSNGQNGTDSTAFGQTAIGGGGGGQRGAYDGLGGGSGGGAGYDGVGGIGIITQGFNGGDGNGFAGAGGGGGATETGQPGNVGDWHNGGDGGNGFDASSYLGTTSGDNGLFAGGGGGGFRYDGGSETSGIGGNGGGGNGGNAVSGFAGGAGLINTGGGGGGGSNNRPDGTNTWHDGASGGSGVVIIRYIKNESYNQASGGTEYDFSDGTNTYRVHLFTSNSTFNINEPVTTNGTPLAWLEHYYPEMDPGEADMSDSDGDGHVAWQEYAADTNPTNAASVLKLTGIQSEAGGMRIEWKGGEQARQFLEFSTNLTHTISWMTIYTNEPETALSNSLIDAQDQPGFYRIRAERL